MVGDGRQTSSGAPQDRDKKKRFPNSIRFTLITIREWWLSTGKPVGQGTFRKQFGPVWEDVTSKYGGGDDIPATRLHRLERGHTDVHYQDLKAYAQFIGIPTSVLSALTHAVGDAAHGHKNEDVANLLESIESSVRAIRDHIGKRAPDEALINWGKLDPETGNREYQVKIEVLRLVSEAYFSKFTGEQPLSYRNLPTDT